MVGETPPHTPYQNSRKKEKMKPNYLILNTVEGDYHFTEDIEIANRESLKGEDIAVVDVSHWETRDYEQFVLAPHGVRLKLVEGLELFEQIKTDYQNVENCYEMNFGDQAEEYYEFSK